MGLHHLSLIGLIGAIFLARYIVNKAVDQIDDSQKLKIMELFSKKKWGMFIVLVPILFLYMWNIEKGFLDLKFSAILFLLAMLIYMSISTFKRIEQMKQLEIDDTYRNAFVKSAVVRAIGILGMFIPIFI